MNGSYHHGDLKQALISAALEVVAQEGAKNLSLRQVAKRVGVSHNAPYRHFPDRDALLAALAEEGFRGLTAAMISGGEAYHYPVEHLTAVGYAYVSYALEHPHHYRLMFSDFQWGSGVYPDLDYWSERAFQVLLDAIDRGIRSGVFRQVEAQSLALVAWSLVHGQALLAIDRRISFASERELKDFLSFSAQMLMTGISQNQSDPLPPVHQRQNICPAINCDRGG